ncbi:GNAT family N-acetyltransferase [Desulfurobacterium thermolithotrophum]|uniref:GNAT family N-acetyltransferase n=1 Tax=Desulfurobacterium thermolithotrophum TaxID=64160 RepID=UPI0013D4C814|nr:GNAT family N-acetyltransferase [Desulfurobacterium thermolithotrophum]
MEIKVKNERIYIELKDGEEAFIAFKELEERKVIIVTTTYVPVNYRGKGIAAKLSEKLVEFAEKKDYKIVPLCSYTQKYLERKKPNLIAK